MNALRCIIIAIVHFSIIIINDSFKQRTRECSEEEAKNRVHSLWSERFSWCVSLPNPSSHRTRSAWSAVKDWAMRLTCLVNTTRLKHAHVKRQTITGDLVRHSQTMHPIKMANVIRVWIASDTRNRIKTNAADRRRKNAKNDRINCYKLRAGDCDVCIKFKSRRRMKGKRWLFSVTCDVSHTHWIQS